jgi:uncharacterized protein (DUF1330 family)
MSAYVLVGFSVRDAEKLQQYAAAAGPTVKQHSGEFLARGPLTVLAGDTTHKVQVVIEFPSREAAEAWYQCDEYQALIALRNEGMTDALFTLLG